MSQQPIIVDNRFADLTIVAKCGGKRPAHLCIVLPQSLAINTAYEFWQKANVSPPLTYTISTYDIDTVNAVINTMYGRRLDIPISVNDWIDIYMCAHELGSNCIDSHCDSAIIRRDDNEDYSRILQLAFIYRVPKLLIVAAECGVSNPRNKSLLAINTHPMAHKTATDDILWLIETINLFTGLTKNVHSSLFNLRFRFAVQGTISRDKIEDAMKLFQHINLTILNADELKDLMAAKLDPAVVHALKTILELLKKSWRSQK